MLSRVLTVACGLSLSVAIAGCVDLAPQAGSPNRDDGPFVIVTVKADTEQDDEATLVRPNTTKGDEVIETQPNTDPNFDPTSIPFDIQQDTATESLQVLTRPSDTQAGKTADAPPESLKTTVQDAAPAPLKPAVKTYLRIAFLKGNSPETRFLTSP